MKKISILIASSTLALLSASAFACPKGTQLQGGTGPHHKGGKCVAITATKAKPAKAKKTSEVKTIKSEKAKTPATTSSQEQH